MGIQIGSITIDRATYQASSTSTVDHIHLNTLEQKLKGVVPDLIGTLIRLIANENAHGEFSLDVSNTSATLTLGGPPPSTTNMALQAGSWIKTVTQEGKQVSSEPVFTDLTQRDQYTRLTTLFITTIKDSRNPPAALPLQDSHEVSHLPEVPTHDMSAHIPRPTGMAPSSATHTETQALQGQLAELLQRFNALENQLRNSTEKLATRNAGIKTLEQEREKLLEGRAQLQAQLDRAQETGDAAQTSLAAKEAEIAQLKDQLAPLQLELNQARNKSPQLEQIVTTQQAQLEAAALELEETKQALAGARADNQALEAQLAESQAALQQNIEAQQQLQSELTTARVQLQGLQAESSEQAKAADVQIKTLTAQLKTKEAENAELSANIAQLEQLLASQKDSQLAIDALKGQLEEARGLQTATLQDKTRLETFLAASTAKHEALHAQLSEEQAKILEEKERLEQTHVKLRQTITELQQKLNESQGLQQKLTRSEELSRELSEKLTNLAEQNAALETSLRETQELQTATLRDKEKFELLFTENTAELETLKTLFREMQRTTALTEKELEDHKTIVKKQVTELSDLQFRRATLEEENRKLRTRIYQFETEEQKISTAKNTLAQENANLKGLLEELHARLEQFKNLEQELLSSKKTVQDLARTNIQLNQKVQSAEAAKSSAEKYSAEIETDWEKSKENVLRLNKQIQQFKEAAESAVSKEALKSLETQLVEASEARNAALQQAEINAADVAKLQDQVSTLSTGLSSAKIILEQSEQEKQEALNHAEQLNGQLEQAHKETSEARAATTAAEEKARTAQELLDTSAATNTREIAQLTNQAEKLTAANEAHLAELAANTLRINSFAQEVLEKNSQLKAKEDENASLLRKQETDKESLESLQDSLNHNTKETTALQKTHEDLRVQYERLLLELKEAQATLSAQESERSRNEALIEQEQTRANLAEDALAHFKNSIIDRNPTLLLNKQLKEKEALVKRLKTQLAANNLHFNATLSELTAKTVELKEQLAEAQEAALQTTNTAHNAKQPQENTQALRQKISELTTALSDMDTKAPTIEQLTKQVQTLEHRLNDKEVLLQKAYENQSNDSTAFVKETETLRQELNILRRQKGEREPSSTKTASQERVENLNTEPEQAQEQSQALNYELLICKIALKFIAEGKSSLSANLEVLETTDANAAKSVYKTIKEYMGPSFVNVEPLNNSAVLDS